jgi:hypothetical protein
MTTIETIAAQGLEIRYYRSFISYEIPFQPESEIPFAATEGLRSYYIGSHDAEKRVVQFIKTFLISEDHRDIRLSEPEEPGTIIYFRLDQPADGRFAEVGSRVDYADTEEMTEIFEGQVSDSGWDCRATLFRREPAFNDVYSYWPNGRLNTRILWSSDGRVSAWHFDQAGHPIDTENAPRPGSTQDDWERRLLEVATDCGISLSDPAVSSEGLYE